MNSLSKSKIAIVFAAVLMLALATVEAKHWLSKSTTDIQNSLPVSTASAQPTSNDPALNTAVSKLNLDSVAASYLAGTKIQIVGHSKTSAHLGFTFPDGLTGDETITLQPDQQYTPTPQEMLKLAQTGIQLYNVKFAATPNGADSLQLTLQYFVPYSSLAPDVQQAIQTQTADWFQLVPSARAQAPALGAGVNIAFGVGKQAAGAVWGVVSAFGKKGQNQQWMNQLAALEKCVQNPTNPLTQAAYGSNPAYQQQTLSNIQNASSSVQQVTAARFLAQLNATAAGLIGGPFGIALGGLTYLNDQVLQDVANQEILDASKNVVNCGQPTPSTPQAVGKFSPISGTFSYDYNNSGKACNKDVGSGNGTTQPGCNIYSDTRKATGTFSIIADQFDLPGGSGAGTFDGNGQSHVDITPVKHFWKETGDVQTELRIGTFQSGIIQMTIHGDSLTYDAGGQDHMGRPYPPTHQTQSFSASCEFKNVDFANGGKYSAFAQDDPHGTCTIELQPQ